jgi:DNA-binding LytR/AlgR family response regulator
MEDDQSPYIHILKQELGLYLKITFGIFLFVLFFQPFPLDKFNFNDRLIFVAGLAGIHFVLMLLVRVVLHPLIATIIKEDEETIIPFYIGSFIFLALSSVAFAFYLKFVGSISITFYVMFKVIFICAAPPVVLRLNEVISALTFQNESLQIDKGVILRQVKKYEEDYLNKSIVFLSDNGNESLDLPIADVAFIKSADNYVEVFFNENDRIIKKLLRNTLKNIENQLKSYSSFVRCHRICIVNTHYIEKLNRNHNHWIAIKGYEGKIPVSRQYLLKIKEVILKWGEDYSQ